MRLAFVAVLALAAAGCASGPSTDAAASQYAAQAEACSSRGGVLTMSMDRRLNGKPGGGYECRLSGGATRIPASTTAG